MVDLGSIIFQLIIFLLDFNEWFTIFHYPTLKYTMELPVLSSDEKLLGIDIKIIPNILLEIVLEDKLRFNENLKHFCI